MKDPVTQQRLHQLRVAAEIGIRMGGLHPHTVSVKPDELAALVEELHIRRGEPLALLNTTEVARADHSLNQLREQIRQWKATITTLSLAANLPPEVRRVLCLLDSQMAVALGINTNEAQVPS